MHYYKNTAGEVFAFSDIQAVPEGMTPLSQAEIDAHLNPPALPKTIFSPRDYLKRFTMTEYAAARSGPIQVQYALDNLIGAQFVDLADPDVAAGLDAMVAAGIIDASRKAELLQAEPAT